MKTGTGGAPVPAPGSGASISLNELIGLRGEASRLRIATGGPILATRHGRHLSRFRGRGMEFDESRVYQPGDDLRNMDWRVTARAGTPHVKCFREERERPVWLLVDQGPTMRFGTRVAFKSVTAARAAALLGWSVTERGDRLGGLVFDEDGGVEQRPSARTAGLLPLLRALAQVASGPRCDGFASLSAAASRLARRVKSGSLVFLISDFVGVDAGDAWIAQLSAGSELVLVHVSDPLERQPPRPGRYPVSDGRRFGWLDMRSARLRAAYVEHYAAHRAQLFELARHRSTHLLEIGTEEVVGPALARGLAAWRSR